MRRPGPAAVPIDVDPWQRLVLEHRSGPLLVLGGPGTGKTTTIVEAVAARIATGVDPEQILVLTFSRKAAAELRDRIEPGSAARPGAPSASRWRAPSTPTPTACCAAPRVVRRRRAAAAAHRRPSRTLVIRRAAAGRCAGRRAAGRRRCAPRSAPGLRRRAARPAAARGRARRRPAAAGPAAVVHRPRDWAAAAGFLEQYSRSPPARPTAGARRPTTTPSWSRAAAGLLVDEPESCAAERAPDDVVSSTSTRTPTRPRIELLDCWPGTAGTWSRSATRTSPSTRSAAPTARHRRRVPRPVPHRRRRARAGGGPARLPPARRGAAAPPTRRVAARLPGPRAEHRPAGTGAGAPAGTARGPRSFALRADRGRATSPTPCAGRTCSTACPGRDMAVVVRSAARQLAAAARALHLGGRAGRVAGPTTCRWPCSRRSRRCCCCCAAPSTTPALDEPAAEALLPSPLGGADPSACAACGRACARSPLAAGDRRAVRRLLAAGPARPGDLAMVDAPAGGAGPRRRRSCSPGRAGRRRPARRHRRGRAVGHLAAQRPAPRGGAALSAPRAARRARPPTATWTRCVALFDAAARFTDRLPRRATAVFARPPVAARSSPATPSPRAPTAARRSAS